MIPSTDKFIQLKKEISKEKRIIDELDSFYSELEKTKDGKEKDMINSNIKKLSEILKKTNNEIGRILDEFQVIKKLKEPTKEIFDLKNNKQVKREIEQIKKEVAEYKKELISDLEKQTLKRLKKKEIKIEEKKEKKANPYIGLSSKIFGNLSGSYLKEGKFQNLKRDLLKANMPYLAKSYLSMVFFTTFLVTIISILLFLFFLFFRVSTLYPFILYAEGNILERFVSVFWILLVFPIITFMFAYFYPSLEKKSIESKINQELPFTAIHMSAISESLVEPSNIFRIIISTKEYPVVEKEFIKLMNEINVYGKDLVSALRYVAFNNPSKKLSELLDGLATTITSGGNLSDFFEKRAQTLLFEYKLDREKQTKSAETFMDIYISVVIAAPMILMLLLIMMRVSGIGIALSTAMISLIMVLGVSAINIIFLMFLQMRQPKD